jgi:predicted aldo/keto reductase-like oxidoreductase
MRYHDGWNPPRDRVHREMIDECRDSVTRALDLGINHIETAHGYGKSEHCLGIVLDQELKLPRERYFFMTKGAPKTADETHRRIEEQLKALRLDHIDLYAWHGINSPALFETAVAKGGPVEVLKRYQEQGVLGCIGFSTHANVKTICAAISTDLFDFVNLHYYYFYQRNWGAVLLAHAHDMGVFVISPNDKGGQLFNAPPLLREICAPLSPIQFNARFCLRTPLVHTLSFGMHQPRHFEEMRGVLPASIPLTAQEQEIQLKLDQRLSVDPLSQYEGYELEGDPSGINIPEVLRFRRMLRCYDMLEFGRYRYNMFTPDSDWFGGRFATSENLERLDVSRVPPGIPLKEMLAETHEALFVPKAAAGV